MWRGGYLCISLWTLSSHLSLLGIFWFNDSMIPLYFIVTCIWVEWNTLFSISILKFIFQRIVKGKQGQQWQQGHQIEMHKEVSKLTLTLFIDPASLQGFPKLNCFWSALEGWRNFQWENYRKTEMLAELLALIWRELYSFWQPLWYLSDFVRFCFFYLN